MNTTNTNILLKTINLTVGYYQAKKVIPIVEAVNLEVHSGEFIALIGANGSGKSTLIKTLSNLLPPLKGELLVATKNLNTYNSLELAKQISIVVTQPLASKNLTVYELVALGRQPYTNWIGTLSLHDKTQIKLALELTETTTLQHKKCYQLSDGQLQKVLIARAIAQDTPIILLDEPTTHLDLQNKVHILKLLQKIVQERNTTILFSTHELNLALPLCSKLLVLQNKKLYSGTTNALIKSERLQNLFTDPSIWFNTSTKQFEIK